jgi:hypothetical protein
MGVTRTESHDDGAHDPNRDPATTPDEAPTGQLLAGTVGDRCVNCGAPLAADQHYCVQCGERRGKSRFSPSATSGPAVQTTTTRVTQPQSPVPARRPSYGTTLVAGIATLLLAMGVGVEIGRISNQGNNSGTQRAAAQPTVIVNGGGGTGTSAATTTAAAQSPAGSTKHTQHAAAVPKSEAKKAQQAAAASKPTQQAVQKASNAAASVLGGSTGQQNATVTTGQSCAAGSAGCQGGHFSGNFFGQ